tara:strand:- start:295 stop:753 length:459 start_codon:yes stop_codon:yes gene_type:complete
MNGGVLVLNIRQIKGEDILLRYNDIKEEFDKALEHSSGEWTAAQITSKAVSEPHMFQIWEVQKGNHWIGIASTRVMYYNNFVALHIITLGGSNMYDDMPELITKFEEIVKQYDNIDVLEFTGRRGFIKQLNTVGWKERYTTMRKSLKENIDV